MLQWTNKSRTEIYLLADLSKSIVKSEMERNHKKENLTSYSRRNYKNDKEILGRRLHLGSNGLEYKISAVFFI